MKFWLIQAIGLAGSLIVILAMQRNNRKTVLIAQATACVLWVFHYGMLGAMTAVFTNFVSLARFIVFYNKGKKWASGVWWMWFFMAAFVVTSLLSWEGPRSLLPTIAMCCTTAALWTDNQAKLRRLFLCASPLWLAYDLISASYSCAIVETVALISYILAIWRFDLKEHIMKREERTCTR